MSIFTGKVAIFSAVAAASLVASAPAQALTLDLGTYNGSFSADFGNASNAPGNINDFFTFTSKMGLAEGGVASFTSSATKNITLTSVTLDGVAGTQELTGPFEVWSFSNIVGAGLHTINVVGTWASAGGSYGGQVDFTVAPAVPEPAAWGMMLLGFGFAGAAMRYGRRKTKVSYA